jgi:hypothetical protein
LHVRACAQTLCVCAAQVLLGRGPYDAAGADVWAAGVVLFVMLTGRLPFCHDTHGAGGLDRAMMQRILKAQCARFCQIPCTSGGLHWRTVTLFASQTAFHTTASRCAYASAQRAGVAACVCATPAG